MKKPQAGFSPLLVLIILAVIGLGVAIYVSGRKQAPAPKTEETVMEKKEEKMMEKKDETMMMEKDKDFDAVIARAPSITLKDVASSGATGTAWLAIYNGKTYHRVVVQNLPALPGTDFYEGWLVKNAATGDFFSTGKMKYNSTTKEATLDVVVQGDKSDYRFVVITSEPDDGNPKPDKHIIEERFAASTNLQITEEMMMMKKEEATMKKVGEEMMGEGEKMMKSETQTFNLTGRNFAFSQTEMRVKKGTTVKVNFESTEGFHDWTVEGYNKGTTQVSVGGKTSVEFVADQAGTFEYYCSVGSHRQLGMVGKLIVE